jgi:hypothetical protein
MARKPLKEARPIGRPPAGAREGEKVKDYPQLSIRLPADARDTLRALSVVGARPQWRVIRDAIDCYLHERPPSEQQMVREIVGGPLDRGPAKRRGGRR